MKSEYHPIVGVCLKEQVFLCLLVCIARLKHQRRERIRSSASNCTIGIDRFNQREPFFRGKLAVPLYSKKDGAEPVYHARMILFKKKIMADTYIF